MTRIRTLVALIATAALTWSGGFVATPAHAVDVTTDLSAVGQRTFEEISRCVNGEGAQLNVLYLLDSSSSMADTDKDDVRADIVAQSIQQLGYISEARPVSLAISSFDLMYQSRLKWSKLTAKNAPSYAADYQREIAKWDGGGGTNWLDALEGAQRTMAAAPDARNACQIIVWLTDGGINVDGYWDHLDQNVDAMEKICGTNPATGTGVGQAALVDSLRTAGVHLIGVLLQSTSYIEELPKVQGDLELSRQTYMTPITEGQGTVNNFGFTLTGSGEEFTYSCGTAPIPADSAAGTLLIGKDPITLAFQFSTLANRIQGGSQVGVSTSNPHEFQIEAGVNGFDIQLASKTWTLTDPEGKTIATSQDGGVTPGVSVSASGVLTTVRVRDQSVTQGLWSINQRKAPSDEPEVPTPNVFVYSLLNLGFASDKLYAGSSNDISIAATLPGGQPGDLTVYGTATLELTAAGKGAKPTEVSCKASLSTGTFTCPYTPDSVGATNLAASLTLTTKSGIAMAPVLSASRATVEPMPEFPKIDPQSITMSALDGRRGTAKGSLTIVGPTKGDGEVCFADAANVDITKDPLPDRRDSYSFGGVPWNSCIPVASGETKNVEFTVANSQAASGIVAGAIPVALKSKTSDAEPAEQWVGFEFESIRKGTPPWWIVLALLLAGILFPIGLLYLRARSAARLRMKGLQYALVPVTLEFVGDTVSIRREGGDGGFFALDEWQYLSSSVDSPRSYNAPMGMVLRVPMPRNPLTSMDASVEAPTGSRVISSDGTKTLGLSAPLGMRPVDQWVVLVSESQLRGDGSPVSGQMLAFVDPGVGTLEEQGNHIAAEAGTFLAQSPWLLVRQALNSQSGAKHSASEGKGGKKGRGRKSDASPHVASTPDASDPFTISNASGTAIPSDNPFGNLGGDTGTGTGNPFSGLGDASSPAPSSDPFSGLGGQDVKPGNGPTPPATNSDPFAGL